MASLRDKVNTTLVRRGGQLVEEATPTSQLAGQAGLVAPPTGPVGVAALGGTPKQQDMAGSGSQKRSALRQSLDTSNTLQEAEADKRYRSAMTAEEQAGAQKQKRLSEVFGSTQEKVQSLVDAEVAKLSAAPKPTMTTAGTFTATDTGQQANVDAAFGAMIEDFAAGVPADNAAMTARIRDIASLTGLTPEQITQQAADAARSQATANTGAAAAQQLTDTITVGSLLSQVDPATGQNALGTTAEELSQLLGLSPSEISTMSLDQINKAVSSVATQGQAPNVAETEAAAQSGLLGAAERAAMRERSRELSTSGVAASEAQLLDLGRSLESADTVQFGGRQWTVEELLSDDSVSQLVSDYLTAPPGSEVRKRLEADPSAAGLLGFVNQYRDALTEAATGVGAAATEYSNVQKANQELANVAGVQLPEATMKALYGEQWGTAQGSRLEAKGIVKAVQELGPEKQAALQEFIGTATADPTIASDIANLDVNQLSMLLTPDSSGKSPWQGIQETRRIRNDLESSKGNIDALLALYFGEPMTMSGLRTAISDDIKAQKMGKPHSPALQALGINAAGLETKGTGPEFANTLYETLSKSLSANDQPSEVLDGSGWKPEVLPKLTAGEVAAYNKRQANLKEYEKQVQALQSYLNSPNGPKDPAERARKLEQEKATLRSRLGIT